MTIRIIRTPTDDSNYEFVVALDGVDYILRLLWNDRAGRWFLTVKDAAGEGLITARKLCANTPFAAHDLLGPAGQLWVMCVSPEDPGLRDLGENAILLYVEEATVAL
jgi:hypothetical protein